MNNMNVNLVRTYGTMRKNAGTRKVLECWPVTRLLCIQPRAYFHFLSYNRNGRLQIPEQKQRLGMKLSNEAANGMKLVMWLFHFIREYK